MATSRLAERFFRAGICTMSREEAVSMIEDFANRLSIDFKRADLEKRGKFSRKASLYQK